MFETSQDILNIVKAVSIFALAAFACFAIYYMAMIMRQTFSVIKEMRDRINKIDDLIKTFKEKIEHSTSYLLLIGEGMKKLVDLVRDYMVKEEEKEKKLKK